MLFMSSPSLATHGGTYKMRVLPRLTIDRILLLSVLLSAVYFILYGTQTFDKHRLTVRGSRRGVHPANAFLTDDRVQSDTAPEDPDGSERQGSGARSSLHIRYPEIVGYPVHGSNTPTCPNRIRIRALNDRCDASPIRNFKYGETERQHLRNVVLDHERKLFYCLIGKAGSKSWLQYLVESKHSSQRGHLRHNDFLEKVGLEMYRNMPLDLVDKRYKNYFKFLVVRHPLQRTVSAYYEMVVFHKKYKNNDGELLNFTEFVQGVTSDMMDLNPHWRRYINRCQVCKVNYEYVIKTETMDEDIKGFNKVIGNEQVVTLDLTHQNRFLHENEADVGRTYNHYKYDKILYELQRKNPDLMKKLINVYGEDMYLFGYKWDWWRGKSTCGAEHEGRECC